VGADPSEILVVYVTAPEPDAPGLARAVVEQKLVACVNIVPRVRSIFMWKGEVQDEAESLLVMKTVRARFEALRQAIVELHPYEVCEVIATPVVAANPPYREWITETTRAEGSAP
jgi:periplasmic divalent cation tolerance protein